MREGRCIWHLATRQCRGEKPSKLYRKIGRHGDGKYREAGVGNRSDEKRERFEVEAADEGKVKDDDGQVRADA